MVNNTRSRRCKSVSNSERWATKAFRTKRPRKIKRERERRLNYDLNKMVWGFVDDRDREQDEGMNEGGSKCPK
jgi:hypothetical protein